MPRILITGGAGFVGSHLAAAALAVHHQVHIVARPSSDISRLEKLGGQVERHRFDLQDDAELRRCLADIRPQIVFHLAASPRRREHAGLEDVHEFVRKDLDSLILLLSRLGESRLPPSVVIRTGSLAEYGTAPPPHREEQREEPVTAYSAALVAATQLVSGIKARLPFPVTTARLALVFGPAQSTDYFIPLLISRCLAEQEAVVLRPDDRRDFIFVDDVVAALLRLASVVGRKAGVINISSGVAPSMRKVAKLIVDLTEADQSLVKYRESSPAAGAPYLCCSPELASRLLGWRTRISLSEGLARTIQWYREQLECAALPLSIPSLQGATPEQRI
jgi:nucleoside-diphosphate-sugar epimerase